MSEETSNQTGSRVKIALERESLAGFRTQLSLDRTTLAWIRTAVTIATFGFGLVAFFRSLAERSPTPESIRLHEGAIQFGVLLILLGIFSMVVVSLSHWRALRRLRQGKDPVLTLWPLSVSIAMLLSLIGLLGLWSLFRI